MPVKKTTTTTKPKTKSTTSKKILKSTTEPILKKTITKSEITPGQEKLLNTLKKTGQVIPITKSTTEPIIKPALFTKSTGSTYGKNDYWTTSLSAEELEGWNIVYTESSKKDSNAEGYVTFKNVKGEIVQFSTPPLLYRSGIVNGIGSKGTKHVKSDPKRNYFCLVKEIPFEQIEDVRPGYLEEINLFKERLAAARERLVDLLWGHPKFRASQKENKINEIYHMFLKINKGADEEKQEELKKNAVTEARIAFGSEEFTNYPFMKAKDEGKFNMHGNRGVYYLPKGTLKKPEDPTNNPQDDESANHQEESSSDATNDKKNFLIETIEEQMKIEQEKISPLGYIRRYEIIFSDANGKRLNKEVGKYLSPVRQNDWVSMTFQFNYWSKKTTPEHGFRLDMSRISILKSGEPDIEADVWVPADFQFGKPIEINDIIANSKRDDEVSEKRKLDDISKDEPENEEDESFSKYQKTQDNNDEEKEDEEEGEEEEDEEESGGGEEEGVFEPED